MVGRKKEILSIIPDKKKSRELPFFPRGNLLFLMREEG